jgi:hypothetical protein
VERGPGNPGFGLEAGVRQRLAIDLKQPVETGGNSCTVHISELRVKLHTFAAGLTHARFVFQVILFPME